MPNSTHFDTTRPYILLSIQVTSTEGTIHEFDAILDTGAPKSEFSDRALIYTGFLDQTQAVEIPPNLQTQKYRKVVLPKIQLCGHEMNGFEVYASRFEESWGIDALVGLDFVRQYRTTIDFESGVLTTECFR